MRCPHCCRPIDVESYRVEPPLGVVVPPPEPVLNTYEFRGWPVPAAKSEAEDVIVLEDDGEPA